MKSKSLVKTLFYLLFFVCGFQYLLMIPTYLIEKNAAKSADLYASEYPFLQQEEKKQIYLQNYLDSISNKTIFKIPYVAEYTDQSLKERQIKPGLDLAGGMQITLGFDMEKFLQKIVYEPNNSHFKVALKETNEIGVLHSKKYINTFFNFYQKIENEENIFRNFSHHSQLKEQINGNLTIRDLEELVIDLSKEMVQQTQSLLEQRINHLGLAQTQITLDINKNQILIEIPGVKNSARIHQMVLSMASLEFWNTYRITDSGILNSFLAAEKLLGDM